MQQSIHRHDFGRHELEKPQDDDDVSDISEEDFLPPEHHGHQIASMKKYRVFWNQQKEEFLLRCFNHYRMTSSSDLGGLKGKSWKRIALHMSHEFHEEYDSKSCRNKMNVLRADYAVYKDILAARASGKETDEFWNQLATKIPRALKWKDSPFPYYETLRRILEENGVGLPSLPPLEIQEVPVNSQIPQINVKKRPRELSVGAASPRKRLGNDEYQPENQVVLQQISEPQFTLASATELVLQRLKEGVDQLADLIKNYHPPIHLENSEMIKAALNELNKDRYISLLEIPVQREQIFRRLNDANTAHSFVLYPDSYKINFLESLLHTE